MLNDTLDQNPLTVTKLAEFFNNKESIQDCTELLAILIQNQSETKDSLIKKIMKKMFLKEQDKPFLGSFIDEKCTRINYGLLIDDPPSHLNLWKWQVDEDLLPLEIRESEMKLNKQRQDFQKEINDFYLNLSAEEQELVVQKKRKRSEEDPKSVTEKIIKTPKNNKNASKKALKNQVPKDQPTVSAFFLPKAKKKTRESIGMDRFFLPFNPKPFMTVAQTNIFFTEKDCDEYWSSIDSLDFDKVQQEFRKFKTKKYTMATDYTPKGAKECKQYFKFLQFHSDVRPPYYGNITVTKGPFTKQCGISAKQPFTKSKIFDYEFDSEAEWEDEEPGEELVSEQESDQEDEEIDQGDWMVPHGYLSDDEGLDNERPKVATTSPKKVVPLVSVIIGPFINCKPDQQALQILEPFSIKYLFDPKDKTKDCDILVPTKKSIFPAAMIPHLQKFIDQQDMSLNLLVQSSIEYLKKVDPQLNITKVSVEGQIKSIAVKEKREGGLKVWHLK